MNNSKCRCLAVSLTLLVSLMAYPAQAQDDEELTAEEREQAEYYQSVLEALDPQSGDIAIGDGLATLSVPDDFYFLDAGDSETVLVDLWGNPPGQAVLGMIFPARYSPLDPDGWAVTVDYIADGHVSDADAADIDYSGLLSDMQAETRATNSERVEAGYEAVELLGWAEPPYYDPANKKLYWAKELRFGDADFTTLNYEIRALGREGMLTMTFIASGSQLGEINASRDTVLAMAEFDAGNRYTDFDPSVDTVAAYGIAALVAGKLASKAGLLAVAAVFLKKFWILLVMGIAAIGKRLKNVLGGATA